MFIVAEKHIISVEELVPGKKPVSGIGFLTRHPSRPQ